MNATKKSVVHTKCRYIFLHTIGKNHIVLSAITLSPKVGFWNGTFLFIVGKNNTSVKYPSDVLDI